MAADNLPDPYRPARPERRTGGGVAPRSAAPAAPTPPVHPPTALELTDIPGRDHWWEMFDDRLRTRLTERVGPTIEWWAFRHAVQQDRPYAVVLGPHGLACTTPTVNDAGRPAHLMQVRRFVPSSLRHVIVAQQPSAGPATAPATTAPATTGAAIAGGVSRSVPEARLALTDDMRGFLGNLPAEAQARLQAPFLSTDPLQASDYFFQGSAEQLDFWCYLAGSRTVTFASGRRVGPAGGPSHAASWQIICRQAEVAPK